MARIFFMALQDVSGMSDFQLQDLAGQLSLVWQILPCICCRLTFPIGPH